MPRLSGPTWSISGKALTSPITRTTGSARGDFRDELGLGGAVDEEDAAVDRAVAKGGAGGNGVHHAVDHDAGGARRCAW